MKAPPPWAGVVIVAPVWYCAGAVAVGSLERSLTVAAALAAVVVLFVGLGWALRAERRS